MALFDTFKFPGGNDVKVYRKSDIIKCIDDNIIDKDVALEIVRLCELDASNFLQEGRWTGIPYIGNIRVPKAKQIWKSKETTDIIQGAKESLDRDKFLLFRKNYTREVAERIKKERYYNYVLSMNVKKYHKYYKYLLNTTSEQVAKIILYRITHLKRVGGE